MFSALNTSPAQFIALQGNCYSVQSIVIEYTFSTKLFQFFSFEIITGTFKKTKNKQSVSSKDLFYLKKKKPVKIFCTTIYIHLRRQIYIGNKSFYLCICYIRKTISLPWLAFLPPDALLCWYDCKTHKNKWSGPIIKA